MTIRHAIAVITAITAMCVALVGPLWIRTTGETVYVATRPIDPLSLFRGNYMDLTYDVNNDSELGWGATAYVLFNNERPASVVGITERRPSLSDGQFCMRGRSEGASIAFPELEQFFVTPERASEIERFRSSPVAVLKVTSRCRAVLVNLEP